MRTQTVSIFKPVSVHFYTSEELSWNILHPTTTWRLSLYWSSYSDVTSQITTLQNKKYISLQYNVSYTLIHVTYLASCMTSAMSRFREVIRSWGEVYICSLIIGNGLVATANSGGFIVSTLLRSLFNIRFPATANQKNIKFDNQFIVCITSFSI